MPIGIGDEYVHNWVYYKPQVSKKKSKNICGQWYNANEHD